MPQAHPTEIVPNGVEMLRFKVENPEDTRNPIPVGRRERNLLVYHGTSSMFGSDIEKNGFKMNQIPYGMDDIETVNKAYRKTGWFGISGNGYPVIGVYTTGADGSRIGRKHISFSYQYEVSRNYSRNPGGETIFHLMIAAEEMLRFIEDDSLREEHVTSLRRKIKWPDIPIRPMVEGQIHASEDASYHRSLKENISYIKEKYEATIENHKPVVYGVSVEPEWFDVPPCPDDVELKPNCAIPPERLLARIDFPQGVVRVDFSTLQL